MLWCGLTYSGHPLACAAGVATIDVYAEDGLLENSIKVGKYLGKGWKRSKQIIQVLVMFGILDYSLP